MLLFLLAVSCHASAAEKRFDPPLERFEAECDEEAVRVRAALEAFRAGASSYGQAQDIEAAVSRRRSEAEALLALDSALDKKVNRYRKNLEGLQINYAAGAINGRNDPHVMVEKFSAQQKTVARLEALWVELHQGILQADHNDRQAAKAEAARRAQLELRRRRTRTAAAALLALGAVLLLWRRLRRRPPEPSPPDPRHRPKGPARLQ